VSEHPGQAYLDAAFGLQEERRLAYIEEAKRDPRSVWFVPPGARDTGQFRHTSRNKARPAVRSVVSRSCGCCGRAFAGRRRDARFCGDVCRVRAGRGRCEEAA
jgi:hypothetical protein